MSIFGTVVKVIGTAILADIAVSNTINAAKSATGNHKDEAGNKLPASATAAVINMGVAGTAGYFAYKYGKELFDAFTE